MTASASASLHCFPCAGSISWNQSSSTAVRCTGQRRLAADVVGRALEEAREGMQRRCMQPWPRVPLVVADAEKVRLFGKRHANERSVPPQSSPSLADALASPCAFRKALTGTYRCLLVLSGTRSHGGGQGFDSSRSPRCCQANRSEAKLIGCLLCSAALMPFPRSSRRDSS